MVQNLDTKLEESPKKGITNKIITGLSILGVVAALYSGIKEATKIRDVPQVTHSENYNNAPVSFEEWQQMYQLAQKENNREALWVMDGVNSQRSSRVQTLAFFSHYRDQGRADLFRSYGLTPQDFAIREGVDYSKGNVPQQKEDLFLRTIAPRIRNHPEERKWRTSNLQTFFTGTVYLSPYLVHVGRTKASFSNSDDEQKDPVQSVYDLYLRVKRD